MASITCGYCGRVAHMTILDYTIKEHEITVQGSQMTSYLVDAAYQCDACDRLNVASAAMTWTPLGNAAQVDAAVGNAPIVRWEPKAVTHVAYDGVPTAIAAAASEAHADASIASRMSAIIMARAVLEACAKDKKADGKDLFARIDQLGKMQLLLPGTVDAAHEVRLFGNDMAHGDFIDTITSEDVDEVLGIMDDILDALYTQPARTARRAEARADRRKKDEPA